MEDILKTKNEISVYYKTTDLFLEYDQQYFSKKGELEINIFKHSIVSMFILALFLIISGFISLFNVNNFPFSISMVFMAIVVYLSWNKSFMNEDKQLHSLVRKNIDIEHKYRIFISNIVHYLSISRLEQMYNYEEKMKERWNETLKSVEEFKNEIRTSEFKSILKEDENEMDN